MSSVDVVTVSIRRRYFLALGVAYAISLYLLLASWLSFLGVANLLFSTKSDLVRAFLLPVVASLAVITGIIARSSLGKKAATRD
jgi:hypothetical protein